MPERLPSLRLVREEVRAEREIQLRHADALDTKAGIVLGFAGVVVAVGSTRPDGYRLPALLVSAASALLALIAFVPHKWPTWDLQGLRDRYVAAEPVFTERKILDGQIVMADRQRDRLEATGRLVRWAITLLFLAVLILAAGTMVSEIGG